MDTSDSDYFESADEDFDCDKEEYNGKQKRILAPNFSHEIIEPELSKLMLDKGNEIRPEIDHKKYSFKVMPNVAQSQEPEDIVKDTSSTYLNNITKESLVRTDVEIDTNLVEGNYENSGSPTHKDKECNFAKVEGDKLQEETSRTAIPLAINEKINQENVWDETDCKLKAAKEQSLNAKEELPKLNNEDNAWDDFDVEWESEDQTCSEKSRIQTDTTNQKTNARELGSSQNVDNFASKIIESGWEDDDWEPLERPEEKTKSNEEVQSSWGGWGAWNVSTILNTATQSVSTITNHVSQGLSTVLESSIGAPDPEEMAKINKLNEEMKRNDQETVGSIDNSPSTPTVFGLDNLVSGVSHLTKFVESTGTKVITGSLDTLETIGKKTMEVLQEGDPGLKKKRAFLSLDSGKPNLSQILREAKEKAENENNAFRQVHSEIKKVKNYEALFDDHQGLVHLEALEMLSKLCNMKLENLNNSFTTDLLKDIQETLEQVRELCELPEDDEEEKISLEDAMETIENAVKEIDIPISYGKLFSSLKEGDAWVANVDLNFIDEIELHEQAIETLAQLTAFAVEQFHKAGELLLVKEHRSTADEADSLVQITTTLKSLVVSQAGKFTDKLRLLQTSDKDKVNGLITNIFYEAANSGSYIQDAFQLLIPVLQVGAL